MWRTAFAYAAVVFVLLQLGEIIFPAFGAPDWALRLLVVACFLGFPLVLALAWVFDITPTGIQRVHAGDSGTTLPRLTLLAVIMATVGGVGWWTVQDTLRAQSVIPSEDANQLVAAASNEGSPLEVRSLAVLPLLDFSEDTGGEYFTAGLHEELISQLSQIGSARVISRTSVAQYDATGKTMPTISHDLGVEGVVEGSVFRDGNRVRITVQLIHGPTDQHLWANSYDGTLEDAIGLQRKVAQAIAREIQAELFPEGSSETPGTRVAASPQVQEEYWKGRYDQSKATRESLESAIGHFEAALQEDSGFAPAYAGLAGARLLLGIQETDSTAAGLTVDAEIVEPLQKAFILDERSPEARAVYLTLRESLGNIADLELPEGVRVLGDSAALLEADVALTATELGRQLQRVVVQKSEKVRRGTGATQAQRIADARRLQASMDLESADSLLRAAVEEAPESQEAWDAFEQLKTMEGNFEAVAQIREERLARSSMGPDADASLKELEQKIAESGEEGYWSWQIQDLRERRESGQRVSPVLMARAHMGLHQEEDALRELEAALEQKDRNLVSLRFDPTWDSIRSDPRFRRILTEMGRPRPQRAPGSGGWF